MINLSSGSLRIKFEFGKCNNRTMKLLLSDSKASRLVLPDSNGLAEVTVDVDLPTQVMLQFTGKDSNSGTILDKNGNIIEDMFVKILSIALDGFELNEKFIHQKIKLLTEDGREIFASYIGFNGTIIIPLKESNIFSQYLLMNS